VRLWQSGAFRSIISFIVIREVSRLLADDAERWLGLTDIGVSGQILSQSHRLRETFRVIESGFGSISLPREILFAAIVCGGWSFAP
jgi:hypothetical protein